MKKSYIFKTFKTLLPLLLVIFMIFSMLSSFLVIQNDASAENKAQTNPIEIFTPINFAAPIRTIKSKVSEQLYEVSEVHPFIFGHVLIQNILDNFHALLCQYLITFCAFKLFHLIIIAWNQSKDGKKKSSILLQYYKYRRYNFE